MTTEMQTGEQTPNVQAQDSAAHTQEPTEQTSQVQAGEPSAFDIIAAAFADLFPQDREQPEEAKPEPQEQAKEEAKEEVAPPVDIPQHWPADWKEVAGKLPPEARALLIKQTKRLEGDYTRKAQEVAAIRKETEQYAKLAQVINTDPGLAQAIEGYYQGKQVQQAQADAPPADPFERLKWEIKQEAIREAQAALAPLQQQMQAMQAHNAIQQVLAEVAADPMREQVYEHINMLINLQPSFARESFAARLNSDPAAFREVYGDLRAQLASRQQQDTNQTPNQPANQQPATPRDPSNGQFVAKQRVAPALESGGNPNMQVANAEQQRLRKTINSGGAGTRDVADFLLASGVVL